MSIKIKVLSRNPDDYLRETKKDIHKLPRNYDPALHPFETPREYTRALNATKLSRVFAKPFLGALEGHKDGVNCLCKHPSQLSTLVSGSYNGEIKLWNLPLKRCIYSINAHEGYVRGITFNPSTKHFISCGEDKMIKQWSTEFSHKNKTSPLSTIIGKHSFHGISHHQSDNRYATCGQQVDIWDDERAEPIQSYSWGIDCINRVAYNPTETNVLGATASDRSIILYDDRGSVPLRKVILKLKSNTLAWNPMEAFIFTVANEDYNLYTFDMRKLNLPLCLHEDHVSAVTDVDYSPTGREFVSGGYDKTLRVFGSDKRHSREVYHTKRMQHVVCVSWSLDNKYLMSGSDEMNIRLWKSQASEKLGVLRPREKEAFAYNDRLKEKFASHPVVKRIARHRHVPKVIYRAAQEHREIRTRQNTREENQRVRSKRANQRPPSRKQKSIVEEFN